MVREESDKISRKWVLLPIGSMYAIYMVTFTINIPPMLAYIPYMDPMGYTLTQLFTTILWLPETKSWATACWAPGMFRHCLQVDIASGDAPEKTVTSSAAEGNDAAPTNSEVSDVSSKRQKAGDIWSMAGLPFDFCPSSMVAVSRVWFPMCFHLPIPSTKSR